MKKIFTYSILLVMAMMTLTSCERDTDAELAYDMAGVWQGAIQGNFYYNRYRSNDYDTEISFTRRDSYGGTGYEIDYSYSDRCYYRNYFDWTVSNNRIILEYDDGYTVIIRDYEVYSMRNNLRFRGYFDDYDTKEELASFNLVKVVNDDCYYNRYYYYTRSGGITSNDSIPNRVFVPADSIPNMVATPIDSIK